VGGQFGKFGDLPKFYPPIACSKLGARLLNLPNATKLAICLSVLLPKFSAIQWLSR